MVNVRMITGDHFETARHVAYKAGIISKVEKDGKDVVMTGSNSDKKLDIMRMKMGGKSRITQLIQTPTRLFSKRLRSSNKLQNTLESLPELPMRINCC